MTKEIKSFSEFLGENFGSETQAELHPTNRAMQIVRALKHAHNAKLNGDEGRHSFWLNNAYSKLVDGDEQE